ncbi:hypothetical protein HPB51_026504 [Rhipicephalus microplus]|uniref:Uncharacterized protein n=1 Tax=Rhipicephalus microplus TaxID=6941 RepID=A0A9J6D2Z2_RHIMP|nr:hypothetical protein HPB51_026504 [Rhipicephalus microplus]
MSADGGSPFGQLDTPSDASSRGTRDDFRRFGNAFCEVTKNVLPQGVSEAKDVSGHVKPVGQTRRTPPRALKVSPGNPNVRFLGRWSRAAGLFSDESFLLLLTFLVAHTHCRKFACKDKRCCHFLIDIPALDVTDVAVIQRLPEKSGKKPGIIIRCIRQSVRDEWLQNRSKLREIKSNLFIRDNLTNQSRQLLKEAKE